MPRGSRREGEGAGNPIYADNKILGNGKSNEQIDGVVEWTVVEKEGKKKCSECNFCGQLSITRHCLRSSTKWATKLREPTKQVARRKEMVVADLW